MVVLSREDARQVAEISAELDTIRIGARSAIEDVLPAARRLLDVEIMSVYSLVESSKGWLFERLVEDGQCGRSSRFWEAVAWAFTRVDTLFYDPRSPAVEMRNRVVESTAWIDRKVPETWLQSQLCRDVFEPSGMEHHKQLRALVCNDDEMLGWFGAITPGPVVPRHYRVLSALVPAMQHRLVAERRLGDACRTRDALERALD
ncbi:MAG: hypothetical protein ABI704_00665, partial [Kofleriaceae bacterium]